MIHYIKPLKINGIMREYSSRFPRLSNFGQTFAFSVYSEGTQFEYAKCEVDQAARTNERCVTVALRQLSPRM